MTALARATAAMVAAALALAPLAGGAGPPPRRDVPTSISATSGHTCASMVDGRVECWGRSYPTTTDSQVPIPVPGIVGVRSVSSGFHYNCALLRSGGVDCWGDDGHGQLGDGTTNDTDRPVRVRGLADAVAVSAGGLHACAVRATGGVVCWGQNLRGALGDGTERDSTVPVAVAGIRHATAVSAGYQDDETCALLAGGRIACWGANGNGQLGDGRVGDRHRPVFVTGIAHAVAVAAGGQHACAVLARGTVYCWGHNNLGQLGTGSRSDSARPRRVRGLPGSARAVAVSARAYSCVALVSGAVYCWGVNNKGQLGGGRPGRGSLVPVKALGVTSAVSISTGLAHACVLVRRGGAECWGYDDYGQLGDGPGNRLFHTPTRVVF